MEMVEIVSPPLEEYLDRVRQLSEKYLHDPDSWFQLTITDIPESELDDRDEFSFIKMALWDKLVERLFPKDMSRNQLNLFKECDAVEPGFNPGSTFWSGPWELINTQNSLLAC